MPSDPFTSAPWTLQIQPNTMQHLSQCTRVISEVDVPSEKQRLVFDDVAAARKDGLQNLRMSEYAIMCVSAAHGST